MFRFDAATVLLEWATGSLAFLWVTTRRREVGIGYGWTVRITFLFVAVAALVVGFRYDFVPVRELGTAGLFVDCAVALWVSFARRRAGVAGQRAEVERRSARVTEMTGIDRAEQHFDATAAEFPPWLDAIAPCLGVVGLVAGGIHASAGDGVGNVALSIARILVGAAFLGAVTDGMLLGHWYLVQPGLPRGPLLELVKWLGYLWPFEVALLLVPTGMLSVISGEIDDGYNGILAWWWVASAVMTIGLVFVTRAALRERQYAAVMAATGLLYLAILTAFGTDLVARALLSG